MKFQIKNRWSGDVQFECELSAEVAGKSYGLQLGFAVKQALTSGSNLRCSDLSGSNLRCSDLSGSNLRCSDLRGSDLSDSNLRGSDLRDSDLRGSNLSGSNLRDSDLRGSDLRGSDLSGSNLRCSNLRDSDLRGSNLSGSDLRGSDDWIPRIENIHQRIFESASKPKALDMGIWHKTDYCGTTHCRAGWVIALAGMPGRVLEGCYGTPTAAALIYQASDHALEKVPDFYSDNQVALADMERLAKAEAERAAAA